MIRLSRRKLMGVGAAVFGGWFIGGVPAPLRRRIRVLIITGQNNHDWRRTTPLMQGILDEADRFETAISTSPPHGADRDVWDQWSPDFRGYDVVLSDYNGDLWPAGIRDQFVDYVAGGGRVLIQHAANNAFPGWREYEQMVGLLWRGAGEGVRVYWNEQGELVREAAGVGIGAGHGGLHDWRISARGEPHPIFRDMPPSWMHAHDELYHGQRGPADQLHLLASAYSSPATGGTGHHEPMLWWVPFERGRVLTFLPGHLWPGQKDTRAFRCAGFRCLLQRCCEWLATGDVEIPVPDPFPTANETVVVDERTEAICNVSRCRCAIC